MEKFKNLKSGKMFTLVNSDIINTTIDRINQTMVLYKNEADILFVCEMEEFHKEFKRIGT